MRTLERSVPGGTPKSGQSIRRGRGRRSVTLERSPFPGVLSAGLHDARAFAKAKISSIWSWSPDGKQVTGPSSSRTGGHGLFTLRRASRRWCRPVRTLPASTGASPGKSVGMFTFALMPLRAGRARTEGHVMPNSAGTHVSPRVMVLGVVVCGVVVCGGAFWVPSDSRRSTCMPTGMGGGRFGRDGHGARKRKTLPVKRRNSIREFK